MSETMVVNDTSQTITTERITMSQPKPEAQALWWNNTLQWYTTAKQSTHIGTHTHQQDKQFKCYVTVCMPGIHESEAIASEWIELVVKLVTRTSKSTNNVGMSEVQLSEELLPLILYGEPRKLQQWKQKFTNTSTYAHQDLLHC